MTEVLPNPPPMEGNAALERSLASRRPPDGEARELPRVPAWAIVGAASAAALLCGRLFASGRIKYGVALLLASIYAPLVFFELPIAFAVWAAVLYVKDFRTLSIGPNAMGLLIALGFAGVLIKRGGLGSVLSQHRRLLVGVVLFLLWLTLSAAWATDVGRALSVSGYWWLGGLAFLITISIIRGRDVGLIALAFVVGATVSAAIGLAGGGIHAAAVQTTKTVVTQTQTHGRLTGGGGDPNVQAAGFIAAMFLAIGLLSVYRQKLARIGLAASFLLVTTAFFATQSRGGLLAVMAAAVAAVALFPGQRRRLVAFVVMAGVIALIISGSTPGAFTRITNFGAGTSGRSDIWAVAAKVFTEHPIAGVGLYNFDVVEPRFALIHRTLTRVQYITETPEPAHNTYLQLLADVGVIGLIGFLAVIVGSLRSAWLASREFLEKNRRSYAYLSQAMVMGAIGMLSAEFFFTGGDDWRLWILLGLGPALLGLARVQAPDYTAATHRPASFF